MYMYIFLQTFFVYYTKYVLHKIIYVIHKNYKQHFILNFGTNCRSSKVGFIRQRIHFLYHRTHTQSTEFNFMKISVHD